MNFTPWDAVTPSCENRKRDKVAKKWTDDTWCWEGLSEMVANFISQLRPWVRGTNEMVLVHVCHHEDTGGEGCMEKDEGKEGKET